MENFNTVPDKGTFGGSVEVINQNFSLAQQEMEVLQNKCENESARAIEAENSLRQLYNNLQQSQPIPVTELPATGEAGKIYRLAGTTSYADYMYAEGALTTPIKMAEYDNAIDDEPTAGSNNLVKSGGVWESELTEMDITYCAYIGKWSCDNSLYAELVLDDTGYNGTFTLKQRSDPNTRLYLNCEELEDNNIYTISFDFSTSNGKRLSTIGVGNTVTASWEDLIDMTGNSVFTNNGHIEFTFKKEYKYLLIAYNASDLTFPMTATVSNFKIIEKTIITEQTSTNRSDIEELKRTAPYTCYDRVENVTSLMSTWETNDSDVWDCQVTDSEIVLTNKVKTVFKYCGFYIGDIPDGTLLEMNFHISGVLTDTSQIGAFNALDYQAWTYIKDKKTNYRRSRNADGNITVVFEKTSDINWIVLSSNSFETGTVIKISQYSLYTVVQNKDLTNRVEQLETINKHSVITSIIPPNYTWEKYMDLQGTFTTGSGQGSCVYDDIFVNASTSNSNGELQIKLYDLVEKQFIQAITLTGITNVSTHANTISFGKKYAESDPLPLLYVPSGYVLQGTNNGQVYVYRFTGTIGNLSASLIQIITLKDIAHWTEWICDAENNKAWIKKEGDINKSIYICYNIPSPQAGDIDIDDSTEKLEEFVLPSMSYPTGVTKSSNQGFMYNKGRIWLSSGVPSFEGEGADACFISAINVRSKCREMVVWLSDVGLTNGTSNEYEPEGIFIWNNELYVPYHGFIAKIKKIDLV